MSKNDNSKWLSEIQVLEDQAGGMFVGGMLLDIDAGALSSYEGTLPPGDVNEVEAFLDSMGAMRLLPKEASIEEMKQQIIQVLEASARIASIAARNFESLPDEAVKSVYDELFEIQAKAGLKG